MWIQGFWLRLLRRSGRLNEYLGIGNIDRSVMSLCWLDTRFAFQEGIAYCLVSQSLDAFSMSLMESTTLYEIITMYSQFMNIHHLHFSLRCKVKIFSPATFGETTALLKEQSSRTAVFSERSTLKHAGSAAFR